MDARVPRAGESVVEALGFMSPEQAAGIRALHARGEGPVGAGVPEQVRRMAEIEPQRMSPERDKWMFEHMTDMPPSANIFPIPLGAARSEKHPSKPHSLIPIPYAVFSLKKKK